MATTD